MKTEAKIKLILAGVGCFLVIVLMLICSVGGFIGGSEALSFFITPSSTPTPTSNTQPTKNYTTPQPQQVTVGPNEDSLGGIETMVPTEQRQYVTTTDLLGGEVESNLYWQGVSIVDVPSQIETTTCFAGASGSAGLQMHFGSNWGTWLLGLQGKNVPGGLMEVVGNTIAFITFGTNQSQIINGIEFTNISDETKTINVVVRIPMQTLIHGVPASDTGSGPDGGEPRDTRMQSEAGTMVELQGLGKVIWFFRGAPMDGVDLGNIAENKAMKRAFWMMLNSKADETWLKHKESIETPTSDTNFPHAYESIVAITRQAICQRIEWQQKLIKQDLSEGVVLEEIHCDELTLNIQVVALKPTCLNGEKRIACATTLQSNNWILSPDYDPEDANPDD